jgi:hypothetical protein
MPLITILAHHKGEILILLKLIYKRTSSQLINSWLKNTKIKKWFGFGVASNHQDDHLQAQRLA